MTRPRGVVTGDRRRLAGIRGSAGIGIRLLPLTICGFISLGGLLQSRADSLPAPLPQPPREAAITGPGVLLAAEDVHNEVVAVADKGSLRCTGTAVARDIILTARHCLPATEVRVGARFEEPRQRSAVLSTVVHPDPGIDAALLRLESPLTLKPVALRPSADPRPPFGQVTLTGYGATSVSGHSGEGRKRLTLVSVLGWGCDGARPRSTGCDPDREMVVPRANGRDTCSGDSGAPIYEHMRDGKPRILAIVSRGLPSRQLACGQGGIYVRADRIADWVADVLNTPRHVSGPAIPATAAEAVWAAR